MFNPEWGEANGKMSCRAYLAEQKKSTLSAKEKQDYDKTIWCNACENKARCPVIKNKCRGDREDCEICPDKLICPLCLASCQTCTNKDKCPDYNVV